MTRVRAKAKALPPHRAPVRLPTPAPRWESPHRRLRSHPTRAPCQMTALMQPGYELVMQLDRYWPDTAIKNYYTERSQTVRKGFFTLPIYVVAGLELGAVGRGLVAAVRRRCLLEVSRSSDQPGAGPKPAERRRRSSSEESEGTQKPGRRSRGQAVGIAHLTPGQATGLRAWQRPRPPSPPRVPRSPSHCPRGIRRGRQSALRGRGTAIASSTASAVRSGAGPRRPLSPGPVPTRSAGQSRSGQPRRPHRQLQPAPPGTWVSFGDLRCSSMIT